MAFGRLERSEGAAPMSDINMTPLIDVMLVLLVIFLVTAPLLASSIRLDLPRTQAAQAQDEAPAVLLVVDKAGATYLDDRPVTAQQLAERLAQIAQRNPDAELQLRADRNVPYGRVVEVMGIAQQAGLERIGFVAEPGDNAP
jgi:biopolymer transport protein TolR